MNERLRKLVETLEADHQDLTADLRILEEFVLVGKGSPGPEFWARVVETLNRVHARLKSHGELEERELYPALRMATGEESDWQLGMTEMQDGLIIKEVTRLFNLVSENPRGISLPELKESATHLKRWLHEHMEIEEKFLFPKILKLKPPSE